ncbi:MULTISPECIES: hypothetical protein [Pedobacter]|uniref:hypothetical protein n=1 Tax=Pedobacter TaxID=84567 RepID=UPI0011FDFA67|nr:MULTISPECIES: hypothetical protein [Pedobacter]RZL32186.1 MAG: hypothetical protein EOO96_14640 [Pedobacter sp.]
MQNPKLYLLLSIAALILSVLSYFIGVLGIGLALSVIVLVLSNKELKKTEGNYTLQEHKNLKIAKRLCIIGIIISSLNIIYLLIILIVVTMGFFGM